MRLGEMADKSSLLRNGFSLAVNYAILNLIMPEYRRKEFYAVTRDIPGADEAAAWEPITMRGWKAMMQKPFAGLRFNTDENEPGSMGEYAVTLCSPAGFLDRKWLLYRRGCKGIPPSLLLCGTILPAGAKRHGTGGSSAGLHREIRCWIYARHQAEKARSWAQNF